ncbi:galactose-3-O-sulfotransferase 2-like [Pecten maximus]|uniref:galactose-3-O-sulfotransferase 2-like n=1 Tax=Pecten maximus TaxID=6579 RepID=UPI00145856E8|nr:galactose-3-O-sulfotransferase 2-like [Pecten maximus]
MVIVRSIAKYIKIIPRFVFLVCCSLLILFGVRLYNGSAAIVGSQTSSKRVFGKENASSQTPHKHSPVRHVAFLKVDKAGSTSVGNIFLRYGEEMNLTFVLPRNHTMGGYLFTSKYFFPPPNDTKYDISCAHAKYNRTKYESFLPSDTKYIGIMREPFSHFQSCVRFYRPKRVLDITGKNPVLNFLSLSKDFRNKTDRVEIICNPTARYLGFPNGIFNKKRDQGQINNYIRQLEKDINFMLILEYLDESIVLMRRILKWDLRHVLYGKQVVNNVEDPRLKFGYEEAMLHKSCAHLDYRLYNLFLDKFKESVKNQPSDFRDEVAYFRTARIKYNNFCLSLLSDVKINSSISFDGSPWNKPFVVTRENCRKMYMGFAEFSRYIATETEFKSGLSILIQPYYKNLFPYC